MAGKYFTAIITQMEPEEISLDMLRTFDLLKGLDDPVLLELKGKMKWEAFPPITLLCHQDDWPEKLYFLTKGLALCYRRTSGTDDRVPIVFLGPGEVIGEIEPLINSSYLTHVKCFAPTEAYTLTVEDFNDLVGNPLPHSRLMEAICKKYTTSLEEFETRMLRDLTEAMLHFIRKYIEANGLEPDEKGFYTIDQLYKTKDNKDDFVLRPRHVGMYSGVSKNRRGQIFKKLKESGGVVYLNDEGSSYKVNPTLCEAKPNRSREN